MRSKPWAPEAVRAEAWIRIGGYRAAGAQLEVAEARTEERGTGWPAVAAAARVRAQRGQGARSSPAKWGRVRPGARPVPRAGRVAMSSSMAERICSRARQISAMRGRGRAPALIPGRRWGQKG